MTSNIEILCNKVLFFIFVFFSSITSLQGVVLSDSGHLLHAQTMDERIKQAGDIHPLFLSAHWGIYAIRKESAMYSIKLQVWSPARVD